MKNLNRIEVKVIKKSDLVGGLIWIMIAVYMCIGSIELNLGSIEKPGPGFIPFISAAILGFFGVQIMLASLFRRSKGGEGLNVGKLWVKGQMRNICFTLLALFVYASLFEPIGFFITTFLFLFFLFKLTEPKKWLMPLVLAGTLVTLSYLVFSVWLMAQFPRGIFR
jgi:putative tricarboxylic transport membrane protein